MRVGLVVFANKYTGAAAVAEHCCRALDAASVEARLLFTAGRNLERRLAGESWAEAGLVKERSPRRIFENLRSLRRFAADRDVVLCHLPHDHSLCVAAGVHRRLPLIRAYRNPRHLRSDPWHRGLARRLSGATLANAALVERLPSTFASLPHLVQPVPLEDRFSADAEPRGWRSRLGIPENVAVLGMVGKLAPGRGFDLLLETAGRCGDRAHVLAVGHGEARPGLERLAARLGLGDRVHWLGYQDDELPSLYAAMDVVLFVAAGSDHGHRAVSEAQGCGRPLVAAGLDGIEDLVEDGVTGLIADRDPAALAAAVSGLLEEPNRAGALGRAAARAVADRRFEPTGHRLADFLGSIAETKPRRH